MKKLIAATVLMLLASVTYAETPSKDSVLKLIELTGAANMGEQMMNQMMPAMRQAMPNAPEEFFTEFKKEARFQDLLDQIIPVYQKHLTQKDVDELNVFYATEVGKKLIKVQPMMMQESFVIGQAWGQSAAERAGNTIQRKMGEQAQ